MGSSMGLPNQRWRHESSVRGEWVEGMRDGVGDSRLLMYYNYHDGQEAFFESVSKRMGIPTVREDNRQSKQRPLFGENL
jgi:hypothetical protein